MTYSTCIDLSLSLETRLEAVRKLCPNEQDDLLEHVGSAYAIHPMFITIQYLQYLILEPCLSLTRRIRVAEMFDLGWSVLYLLTRMDGDTTKIRCIEQFSNPYLKLHAYSVLFTRAPIETQIQIHKNIYLIPGVDQIGVLNWFETKMGDESLEYKVQSNCADAILTRSQDVEQLKRARKVLQLVDLDSVVVSAHRENVHLFLPNLKLLDRILRESIVTDRFRIIDETVGWIEKLGYSKDLFVARILNDTTRFGRGTGTTLEDLFVCVWSQLTDDLRLILIDDLYSSDMNEEQDQWMCTTGYYNRILNIYQAMLTDQHLFESQQEFTAHLTRRINYYLSHSDEQDDILLELPHNGEERRIRYLTFKVHALPLVLREMREAFPNLSEENFDECFANALRHYENTSIN